MISKSLQIRSIQPYDFKSFSRSVEHFFLTIGQNNFGNKIPFHEGDENLIESMANKVFFPILVMRFGIFKKAHQMFKDDAR